MFRNRSKQKIKKPNMREQHLQYVAILSYIHICQNAFRYKWGKGHDKTKKNTAI